MVDHHRHAAAENIERFERLLRGGQLDRQQTELVTQLLAAARTQLSLLEREGVTLTSAPSWLSSDAAAG